MAEGDWVRGVAQVEPRQVRTLANTVYIEFKIYKEDYDVDRQRKIFLSHKGIDKPLVREYFRVLKTLGFDPWLDEDAMTAGTELERGILQGFKDSCAAVFFITPNYADANYLATEVDYAIQEKRAKGDRFQIVTMVFTEKKQKGKVPDLLRKYVWKEPESQLEALNQILLALPISVGPVQWKPQLAAPADPLLAPPPEPIVLRAHDAFFRFIGRDSGGGTSNTTRDKAEAGEYCFKLSVFNPRAGNVGLMDLYIHYAKGGVEIARHVPSEHTGEVRMAQRYCPDITSMTLSSKQWIEKLFLGGVRAELAKVADSDEIYLTAKSTTGEDFQVPLARGFVEK